MTKQLDVEQGEDGVELRAEERQLVGIRRRATQLAVALVREPFSSDTAAKLRAYVSQDAEEGQSLADALRAQPPEVLKARIAALAGRTLPEDTSVTDGAVVGPGEAVFGPVGWGKSELLHGECQVEPPAGPGPRGRA